MRVLALVGRTSEHGDDLAPSAAALARAVDPAARVAGEPARGATRDWSQDLPAAAPVLRDAGAFAAEDAFGVLTAGQCTVAMTTLPAVAARRPGVRVLWLDAHGDFNTPATSPSGFLGGMPLAAACGVWDAGVLDGAAPLDPRHVVLAGARDLDPGEERLLGEHGVRRVAPADVPGALAGAPVYVHLDADVLDPEVVPSEFAVPGGLSDAGLRALLEAVAASAGEVVGLEVTAFGVPEDRRAADAARLAHAVAPLLPR